jgi:hypothetical protein
MGKYDKVPVTIRIPEGDFKRAKKIANTLRIKLSDYLRGAIRDENDLQEGRASQNLRDVSQKLQKRAAR